MSVEDPMPPHFSNEELSAIYEDPKYEQQVAKDYKSHLGLLKKLDVSSTSKQVFDKILAVVELCETNPPGFENVLPHLVKLLAWLAADDHVQKESNQQQGTGKSIPKEIGETGYNLLLECAAAADRFSTQMHQMFSEISRGDELKKLLIALAGSPDEEEAKKLNSDIGELLSSMKESPVEKVKQHILKLHDNPEFKKDCLDSERGFFLVALELYSSCADSLESIRKLYKQGCATLIQPYENFIFALGLEFMARDMSQNKIGLEACGLTDLVDKAFDKCMVELSSIEDSGESADQNSKKRSSPSQDDEQNDSKKLKE